MKEEKPIVISLGGSLIVPDEIDTDFLSAFKEFIEKQVADGKRFVIVTGGGAAFRRYRDALHAVRPNAETDNLHLVGVLSISMNARLVRFVLGETSLPEHFGDPSELPAFDNKHPVIVAAGFVKLGVTSDYYTVEAAHKVGATTVVNLSNVTHVYSEDPKKNPNAEKLLKLSWGEYRKIIPREMTPGLNTPFDPVASKRAQELGLTVVIMGSDISNLERYLDGKEFEGTVIS